MWSSRETRLEWVKEKERLNFGLVGSLSFSIFLLFEFQADVDSNQSESRESHF